MVTTCSWNFTSVILFWAFYFWKTWFLSIIWRHRFYCNIIFVNEDTGYRQVVTKILMVNANGTLLSQETKLIDPIIGFERNQFWWTLSVSFRSYVCDLMILSNYQYWTSISRLKAEKVWDPVLSLSYQMVKLIADEYSCW